MTIKYIDSLILFTSNLFALVEFYKSIGIPFEEEDHGEGPIHYACDLNGAHIAIFESSEGKATERGVGGSSQIGFQVDNVDAIFDQALKAGAKSLIAPQERPWGKRAVFEDLDGRSIEINQAPS